MAEETIGLRIQLNGINTVIQDVETFEKILKEAREDLATIGIQFGTGSKEYRQLATELQGAEKQFSRIKNGTKAARAELEDYRRGTEALSKAFAGATAALTLFGGENEEVTAAQKVAAQGLTVVIAAQTIAQTELGGATIATTIATRAQTIATTTSSAALRGLFTLIAANPIGALVAVLGLAVAAFTAFRSGADEAAKAQEEFNNSVNQDAGKSIATFRSLTSVIDDQTLSLETRKEAIADLRKQYPGYAGDLSDEEILVGGLKDTYKDLEQAIIQAARAKAAQTRIETLAQEELEINEKLLEATNNRIEAEKSLQEAQTTTVTGGGSVAGLGGQSVNLAAYEQRLKDATEAENELLVAQSKNLAQQTKYGVIIKNNTKDTEEFRAAARATAKAEEDAAKATKAQEEAQRKLLEAYKLRIAAQLEVIKNQNKINEGEVEISTQILENAKKLIDDAQSLLKDRTSFYKTEADSLIQEIQRVLFAIIPTGQQIKDLQDSYINIFNDVAFKSEELFGNLEKGQRITIDTIIKGQIRLLEESGKLTGEALEDEKEKIRISYGKLNDDQQTALLTFFNRTKETIDIYSKGLTIDGAKIIFGTPEELRKNLRDGISIVQTILNDRSILPGLKNTEIERALTKLFPKFEDITKDGVSEAYKQGLIEARNNLLNFLKVQAQQLTEQDKVNQKLNEYRRILLELRLQQGVLTDNVKDFYETNKELGLGDAILTEEQFKKLVGRFRLTEEKLQIFIEKIGKASAETPEVFGELVEDITKNLDLYRIRLGDEGILGLFNTVGNQISGTLTGKTEEELKKLLEILQEYATKLKGTEFEGAFDGIIKNINNAISSLPENTQKAIKIVDQSLKELQGSLGQLAQAFGDRFAFELERLESDYKSASNSIVGDTKEANEKRIELEKAYQAEKKRIEKQARLTSLRITLAETLAAGAQGVVQAITAAGGNPAVAAIFGAINASITAFQVGLIAQQISFVSQLRRGGRLAAGGLVMGPSHENGGVRYMNGGVELEGNEAVVNRNSTIKYGSLLSSINQAEGGRPILVGNAMDSRLIEVLAKQKQEPIRAYVLESDITKSQTINRKLEQLASF